MHFSCKWKLVPFLFVHGMVLFYDNRKLSNVVETHSWFDESNKNNQKCNWGPSINDIAFWLLIRPNLAPPPITFDPLLAENPFCHHFCSLFRSPTSQMTSFMNANDKIWQNEKNCKTRKLQDKKRTRTFFCHKNACLYKAIDYLINDYYACLY